MSGHFSERVTVGLALTEVLRLNSLDCGGDLNVEVVNLSDPNVDDIALDEFEVQLRDHPDGEWYTYLSGTDFEADFADFDADGKPPWLTFVSENTPHDLEAGDTAHFHIDVHRAQAVRFMAACEGEVPQEGDPNTAPIIVRGSFAN